jgi:hypothetical protein
VKPDDDVKPDVVYFEAFWDDIVAAAGWYENREPGLAAALAADVSVAIERIIEAPLRNRTVYRQVRCLRAQRFPHAVLYLLEGNTLAFVGLKHGAQDMRRFVEGRLPKP